MLHRFATTLDDLSPNFPLRSFTSISLLICIVFGILRSLRLQRPSLRKPPSAPSPVPFLGHLWGIITRGLYPYFSALCVFQSFPIWTVKIPGQNFHLIKPSQSRQLSRTPHLSLAGAFYFAFGRSFGLSPSTGKLMMDLDKCFFRELSRLFHDQFMSVSSLRMYASQVDSQVHRTFQELPKEHRVSLRLGDWIFEVLAGSVGRVVWGENSPFKDPEFRKHVRVFFQNLDALANPIPFLIPSHIRTSRKIVRDGLSRLAAPTRICGNNCEDLDLLPRIAELLQRFEVTHDGWVDSQVMLLSGLLPSSSKVLTWCMYEILGDPNFKATILAEVNNLANVSDPSIQNSVPTVDLSRIHSSCPHLVATWYEVLRLRGDFPITRYVHKDTIFASQYRLQKGDILMVPLQQVHFNSTIWGEDVHTFRPDRFLDEYGQLDAQKTKLVKTFGLPEPQCPGRFLAFTLVMSIMVRLLLTFELMPVGDEKFRVPKSGNGVSLGPAQVNSDPEILLQWRKGAESVIIRHDKIVQRW